MLSPFPLAGYQPNCTVISMQTFTRIYRHTSEEGAAAVGKLHHDLHSTRQRTSQRQNPCKTMHRCHFQAAWLFLDE